MDGRLITVSQLINKAMENKEPIKFHIKSGGPVKNMIKIMNQLSKANRPVIFTYDTLPSAATMMFLGTNKNG